MKLMTYSQKESWQTSRFKLIRRFWPTTIFCYKMTRKITSWFRTQMNLMNKTPLIPLILIDEFDQSILKTIVLVICSLICNKFLIHRLNLF